MKEIGNILKEAREKKGLSLSDAHEAIKIQEKYLAAIESGDIDALPAEIYYKTFMKSYAKYLGLDPEILAKQYEEKKEKLEEDEEENSSGFVQGMFSNSSKRNESSKRERENKEKKPIDTVKLIITLLIAVSLLAAFIYLNKNIPNIISENSNLHEDFILNESNDDVNMLNSENTDEEPTSVVENPDSVSVSDKKEEKETPVVLPIRQVAIPTTKPTPYKRGPIQTPTQQTVVEMPSAKQEIPVNTQKQEEPHTTVPVKQKLNIEAVENVWIRVEADSKEVFQGTVLKGSYKEWEADTAFVLKVGYTPGIKVNFNGEAVDIIKGSVQDVNTVILKRQ